MGQARRVPDLDGQLAGRAGRTLDLEREHADRVRSALGGLREEKGHTPALRGRAPDFNPRFDGWLLFDMQSPVARNARARVQGSFDRPDGRRT